MTVMFRKIQCLRQASDSSTVRIACRSSSFASVKSAFRRYLAPRNTLPYGHICQVGDPVLRAPAQPIDLDVVTTPQFRRLVEHLTSVLRKHKAMGLSANQIGVSYQIVVLEITQKHLERFDEAYRKSRQIELTPLQVFINPKMKIIDYATSKHTEECLSILGHSAVVPRAKTIQIEAINVSGQPFVWKADGWAARIAQHEMDHLQGKLYIDRMDPSTFSCKYWALINNRGGNVGLTYYPQSSFRRFFFDQN